MAPVFKKLNKILAFISLKLRLSVPLNLPVNLMIEPTNRCNLKCPLCPTGSNELEFPKIDMAFELYKKIIDELKNVISSVYLCGFGEPLLCKDIFRMIQYSRRLKINTELSTNGTILNSDGMANKIVLSGLDEIRICLDGASNETLNKYRIKANMRDILEGIEKLIHCKKLYSVDIPEMTIQFIVMRHNEHEIEDITKIAKNYKIKLKLKTVEINQTRTTDALSYLPLHESYSRYRYYGDTNRLEPIELQSPSCHYPYDWGIINADGSVVPCCKDPFRLHSMGSILEKSFKQIWRSARFMNFRNLLKHRVDLEGCDKCVLPRKITV